MNNEHHVGSADWKWQNQTPNATLSWGLICKAALPLHPPQLVSYGNDTSEWTHYQSVNITAPPFILWIPPHKCHSLTIYLWVWFFKSGPKPYRGIVVVDPTIFTGLMRNEQGPPNYLMPLSPWCYGSHHPRDDGYGHRPFPWGPRPILDKGPQFGWIPGVSVRYMDPTACFYTSKNFA